MNLALIEWTVSPVAFSIGPLVVRWYGILLATGFFLAYLTLKQILVVKNDVSSIKMFDKLSVWTIIWTVIGLRLGHFLFYEPEFLIQHPLQVILPFDENWNFTGFAGLASHGGTIAIILFLIYFARKHKLNILWLIDRLAVCIPIAAAFVRVGNLMNHEIVGSITDVAWAFNFTQGGRGVAGTWRHPAQLYESFVYLSLYFGLVFYYFKIARSKVPAGRTTGILLTVIFSARFIIEFFKEVQVDKETGMMFNIGQWLSVPFILIGLGLLIYSFRKPKTV